VDRQLLEITAHRTAPMPRRPWLVNMAWRDLLFAHWRLDPAAVRARVPQPLELETHDGAAWVGVIPFVMDFAVRSVPVMLATPEINVRTYVRFGGIPGVYFFSLDLASVVGVLGARIGYGLPYWPAQMWARRVPLDDVGEEYEVRYGTARVANRADFWGCYRPIGPAFTAAPGTVEHFVTERYCLYNVERGKVYRVPIHHLPWLLQPAEAEIVRNNMAAAAGITLPDSAPLLHFARELEVLAWTPERVG
jgi:uncharacterized protein YqjF (DUF2071 family)